ncbi:DNA alkylation repair protein [Paracoccus sp. T5]|uniref:DNA alkylation repair protein n=1 Tax=Paracoccus sp. T5 TaxID=3402161 RepID=UPI003AEA5555
MQELDQLRALGEPERAARLAARHKTGRETLGVTPADLDAAVAGWREALDVEGRLALARALWDSDIHEARLAAARLLVQARMRPDAGAWQAILDWAPQIDGAEIADAVMAAASRRLLADPSRLDQIEPWLDSNNPWLRRSLMIATLRWAKMNHPKPVDLEHRERILDWAHRLAFDRNGAVRQAVETWLRDLGRHDAARAAEWQMAQAAMPAQDAAEADPQQADGADPDLFDPDLPDDGQPDQER